MAVTEAKKEGQVVVEVNRQKNLSNELRETVDNLEVLLVNIVTTTEPPKPTGETETNLVSLAKEIKDANDDVQDSIGRLASISNRIEI